MNKRLSVYKPIVKAINFLIGSIVLVKLLSRMDVFVNEIYPKFYGWFYPFYTQVFGWVPFSVGDIFYLLLLLYFLFNVYVIIRCFVFNQKWRSFRFLGKLIFIVSVFILLFHFLWAFNYHRNNLIDAFPAHDYDEVEVKKITQNFLMNCQQLREEVDEDKFGVFTYDIKNFSQEIPPKLNPNQVFPYQKIPKRTHKKWSFYSWMMRYAGISGYYNPFTAEAQVTRKTPDVSLPFTLAHEQAHQMGYAPEYEANFIGFLTCYQSNSVNLKYSANYKALKYLLRDIYPVDSSFVYQTLDSFTPAMKRDYRAEKLYHQKYAGKTNEFFSSMNHIYLKSNQQEKGIESYNQFVELLLNYIHEEGL